MNLTKEYILSCYDKTKRLAKKSFEKGRYNRSLKYINIAARIAYQFNWIYRDDDLEELLANISKQTISKRNHYTPIENRYVLYVASMIDNRGEIQQYLRALIACEGELLVIVEKYGKEAAATIAEIKAYPKAKIYALQGDETDVESNAQKLYDKIVNFRPSKLFMHLRPESGFAITVFDALPEEIINYQINLTDHAFWLGCKCLDYIFEFRPYGCTVSQEKRKIDKDKILLLPYYPILNHRDFQGFPSSCTADKIILFSGGELYKIYGGNGLYFKIVKHILDENPQAILLYAGDGDTGGVNAFIAENKYENRFILLGFRQDINEVFKHCDIYLCTYPSAGGLMCQYAAVNGKPILAYNEPKARSKFIEDLICVNANVQLTFTDPKRLTEEAGRLITDKKYRKKKGAELQHAVMTQEQFEREFKSIINSNKNRRQYEHQNIDYDAFFARYLELENEHTDTFKLLIIRKFKFATLKYFPRMTVWFIVYMLSGKGFKFVIKRKVGPFLHKQYNKLKTRYE